MQNKKNVIIVIVILLILVILTVVVLLFTNLNEDNITIDYDSSLIESPELKVLENRDNAFFTVQKIINNYYEIIKSGNKDKLYNILDQSYVIDNGISIDNVYNFISNNYEDTSYIAKDINYIKGNDVTYYLVNGYLLNNIIVTEEVKYYNDINFLVTIDDSKQLYVIYPMDNMDENTLINNYQFRNGIKINENNKVENITISEENKLTTYINEFLTLMFVDTNRAYGMLDDDTLDIVGSLDEFETNLMDIYDALSPVIFSYTKKEFDDYILFEIIDNNDNRIKIMEYNTMNYRIGFNF